MYFNKDYDVGRGYNYFSGEFIYGDDVYVPEEYIDERWWYIEDAPDYMISDRGRVWSERSQQFLKPKPMDREGHLGVTLHTSAGPVYRYIHRLIAKAFIPNPNNYPIVRHLDDDRDNVWIENLAWGTQSDNIQDAIRNGRTYQASAEVRERVAQSQRKPLIATNLKTGERVKFRGQSEAARILGIPQANIWKVLNGERFSAGGYHFDSMEVGDNE